MRPRPLPWFLLAILACSSAPSPITQPLPLMDAGLADDAALVEDEPTDAAVTSPSDLTYAHNVQVMAQPSDNGAALLAAVKGAQKSILVEMYLFTNTALGDALIARKQAGVTVKVVLNQQFPYPGNDNLTIYNKLKGAGVAVVWAPSGFVYTHSKTFVIDGKEAWITTMNATQTSARENREYLVVDREPQDIAEAAAILEADFAGTAIADSPRLVTSPINARARLLGLIDSAQKSVDIEAEVLSDADIIYHLVGRKLAGVAVRVVVGTEALDQTSATVGKDKLKRQGIDVRALATPSQHAKALVVDGARAYVGSVNFTKNSMDNNREIGVLFDEMAAVKVVADTFNTDHMRAVSQ